MNDVAKLRIVMKIIPKIAQPIGEIAYHDIINVVNTA